jgi:hypothetical protein
LDPLIKSQLLYQLSYAPNELAGKGDAALEAACGTLRAELGRQLPEAMAFGLRAGFASMVRDRLEATKH